jgi:uncharacterized protein
MVQPQKIIFVLTNLEDNPMMLETPFNLALLAAAIDVEVAMVFTGKAGKLLKKVVADITFSRPNKPSLLENIRKMKNEGIKIYLCSPVLDFYELKKEEMIEEIDAIIGGMFLITESLEADVVYSF